MSNSLQATLQSYVQSGWESNPATNQIINGYAHYHAALAVVGALFLLITLWLSVRLWMKFKRTPKNSHGKWPFEKKVYIWFATLFTLVTLFLALIVTANISTAVSPVPGFQGSINSLSDNSYNKELHSAFNDWIVSGKSTPPALVQERMHERRVFHGVRLIVSSVLLVGIAVFSVRLWKWLILQRNDSESRWSAKQVPWLITGIVMVLLALILMLVVMANLQSTLYPIANTIQFG